MPIYLAHGFRWPRDGFTGIRVHVIVNDLEDVSVEYIQNEHSRACLLQSFRDKFPTIMQELEKPGRAIDFLEQYDPDDVSENAITQPWAFVCDRVVMIAGGVNAEYYASKLVHRGGMRPSATPKKERQRTLPMTIAAPFTSSVNITNLSVNIEEVTADGPGLSTEAWQALADLRDQIAEGEIIGWWVLYNGDPDRDYEEDAEDETTLATSQDDKTPKSPTGGRMPPPIPPQKPSQVMRSSTQSTLTTSSTPASKERTLSDASSPSKERSASEPSANAPDATASKSISKGQGLKKLFSKKT